MRNLILLLPLLPALLSGCGPAGNSEAAVSPQESTVEGKTSYPSADYKSSDPGKPGGTLKVSVTTDTGTLDFQLITNTNAKWLGRLIYDNLVYLDEAGGITPWLAKSWEISPDGKTYTFHLRDDVTFSDGVKFNAEAVRVNLDRMRDPATKAAMTTAYIAPYVDGKVIDEYTFQANLSEAYTPFLNVLAQSWLGMVSPKAIRENPKGIAEAPVGSGPFLVESYIRQQGIRFIKRPDYHWSPPYIGHQGPAYLDRIEVEFVPEAIVRYTSLASGQYDFTIDAPPQNAAAIRSDPNLRLASRINLGNPTRAITFNTSKEPFTDLAVRKAFALAIDREGIERITGFGEYRLKTDFLSATTPYYDPSFDKVLVQDIAEADRLLDSAGWATRDAEGYRTKQGKRLGAEILVSESSAPSGVVVALQSDVKRIGFDLQIVQLPTAQLAERRNANSYQALGSGFWHTNTPDGLFIVYHSKQIISERFIGQNTSRLQDAKLDELLSAARQSREPANLKTLYSQAQERLTQLVPAVPLYENHTLIAYRKNVRNVVFDTSHNTPYLPAVWLE